jgi:hypothetical protein
MPYSKLRYPCIINAIIIPPKNTSTHKTILSDQDGAETQGCCPISVMLTSKAKLLSIMQYLHKYRTARQKGNNGTENLMIAAL